MNNLHPLISFAKTNKAAITKWVKIRDASIDVTFNVFNLFSDTYYRENFHSYFLAAILDPNGTHGQEKKFVLLFIDLINNFQKVKINWAYEDEIVVQREIDRIDISIFNETKKSAIIIENKINNAGDTKRQLPSYFDRLEAREYKVEAIIYIPLDISKKPSEFGWKKGDREKVNPKLVIIPALDSSEKNIVNGFISQAINKTDNLTIKHTLIQYKNLLEQLAKEYMQGNQLDEILNSLDSNVDYNGVINAIDVIQNLPSQFANRLYREFDNNCQPFSKAWIYAKTVTVLDGLKHNGNHFAIDIKCELRSYSVQFFERKYRCEELLGFYKEVVDKNDLERQNQRFVKTFEIDNHSQTEARVIKSVISLCRDLSAAVKIEKANNLC